MINGYGIVIPEGFSTPSAREPAVNPVVDEAANILGERYYKISFYRDEEFAGESYYISADNTDNIFLVSMVDGSLIPISYGQSKHLSVGR